MEKPQHSQILHDIDYILDDLYAYIETLEDEASDYLDEIEELNNRIDKLEDEMG